jgi:transposase
MIALPPNARVWLAAGATDMRKGFDGLAAAGSRTIAADLWGGIFLAYYRSV